MRNYESVPPHLRDTLCKCTECGATWIGPLKPLCSECAPTAVDNVLGADNAPPVPESARADMMRQLVNTPSIVWKEYDGVPYKGMEYDLMWVDDCSPPPVPESARRDMERQLMGDDCAYIIEKATGKITPVEFDNPPPSVSVSDDPASW